jgi:hypothetical protein
MAIANRKAFQEGKTHWQEYVNLNGYAFRPDEKGLKALSRSLGIPKKELREKISVFLEA